MEFGQPQGADSASYSRQIVPQALTNSRQAAPLHASFEAQSQARGPMADLLVSAPGPGLLDLPNEVLDLIGRRLPSRDLLHLSLGSQRTYAILERHLRSAALCARVDEVRTLEGFNDVLSLIEAVEHISLRIEPLTTLARRSVLMPSAERRVAFQATLHAIQNLTPSGRVPALTALAGVIGALVSAERVQVIDAVCAAIDDLEPAARAAPLAMLVRHAPVGRGAARVGVVNKLFQAIGSLPSPCRSAPLREMTMYIAGLHDTERAAACQRYFRVLDSIDATIRLPPLLALLRQLRIVPQDDRLALFERCLQYGRQMHAGHRVMVLRELGSALCHLLPSQQPGMFSRIAEDTLHLGPARGGDRIAIISPLLHLLPPVEQADTVRFIMNALDELDLTKREHVLNDLLRYMHLLTPQERLAVYDRIFEVIMTLPAFACSSLLTTLTWRLPRIEPIGERMHRFERIVGETRALPPAYRLSIATALAWMVGELPELERKAAFATLEAMAGELNEVQGRLLADLLLTLKRRQTPAVHTNIEKI